MSAPVPTKISFGEQVRRCFGEHATTYNHHARLQQAVAWRLAHHCQTLRLLEGPRADLGAGTGLVGQALGAQGFQDPARPFLQLDLCPELLARNPLAKGEGALTWDLNQDLPPQLSAAALFTSSFALQWLERPSAQLEHWCSRLQPSGWLALAVPIASSFPEWHQAAALAGVPCTALGLPAAAGLIAAAERHLLLKTCQQFSMGRRYGSGAQFLRQLQQLGAGASPHGQLSAGALRRLLRHWPSSGMLHWHVLLLVGQRKQLGQRKQA